jgi:hypothetical protein
MSDPASMLPVLQAALDRVIAEDQNRQSAEIIQLPLMGRAIHEAPQTASCAPPKPKALAPGQSPSSPSPCAFAKAGTWL